MKFKTDQNQYVFVFTPESDGGIEHILDSGMEMEIKLIRTSKVAETLLLGTTEQMMNLKSKARGEAKLVTMFYIDVETGFISYKTSNIISEKDRENTIDFFQSL